MCLIKGCICWWKEFWCSLFLFKKTTKQRATHEVQIHSHISSTSPHRHQGCLDTYHSDISICQVLYRKKVGPRHVTISWLHFEHLHWSGITVLWGNRLSLGTDGSPTVPDQDCVLDVEEFPSTKISRDLQLRQHWEVEHFRAREELLWSKIRVSFSG